MDVIWLASMTVGETSAGEQGARLVELTKLLVKEQLVRPLASF